LACVEWTCSLDRICSMFPAHVLAPTIAKIRHARYSLWRRTLSHNSLSCQIPSVSWEKLALLRFICCELSRLRCHGHSLLLYTYLCRIKRKENSCSACGHPLQDLAHLLDCPASDSIFDLWSGPWGVARLLDLRGIPLRPHPSEGIG